jgi:CheY-like chemotaxis protein
MSKGTILIVEDNALNMELALALLEQADFTALEATSAEVGIETAKAQSPELILMDVSLPGMSGLEAVRLLKADPQTSSIPVVVMTSHALSGDEKKATDAGSDGYVTKPINLKEFRAMLERFFPPA